jgi:Rad3-related DNA helicase
MNDFEEGGTLSQRLPWYQPRASQREMARIVTNHIGEAKSAVIEAPTGTGKSLAYLIPAVRSGKKTIISTAKIALQEQIFYKDIPFVQKHIQDFKAVILKGMGNFLCLDRLKAYREENQDSKELDDLEEALLGHGDFEKLSFRSNLQPKINGNLEECTGKDCPFYKDCFYYSIKREAKEADVIVINHTMLALDIALGGRLLPACDVLIIDEAHELEERTREFLSIKVTIGRFVSLYKNKHVRSAISHNDLDAMRNKATDLFRSIDHHLAEYEKQKVLIKELPEGRDLFIILGEFRKQLQAKQELLEEEANIISTQPAMSEEEKEEKKAKLKAKRKEVADHKKLVDRTDRLKFDTRKVCTPCPPEEIRLVSKSDNGFLEISCYPIDMSKILKKELFDKHEVIIGDEIIPKNTSIICTSATLCATENNFDFFIKRVGMEPNVARTLPHVFDYQENALLYVPKDIKQPEWNNQRDQERYENQVAERMQQLVEYSQGRAFLLFTSRKMMNAVHSRLRVPYQILKQDDLPKSEMIKQFKEKPSVLLGVASFWEGVDIPGQDLSLVVIDKIPFNVPTDPIYQGIINLIKQRGENKADYDIPYVTIKLKQGAGRLIRAHTDRGVIAILDQRMHKYSKILTAMPPAIRTTNIADVDRFFHPENHWDDEAW